MSAACPHGSTNRLHCLPDVPTGPNWLTELSAMLDVEAAGIQFLKDGGDPSALRDGESALLGQPISSLEVARDLIALS